MKDYTISSAHANTAGILLALFLYIPADLVARRFVEDFSVSGSVVRAGWVFWVLVLVSLPVHEYLHLFGFRVFGKVPWSSMQLGFSWKVLGGQAHCSVPMEASAYRMSGLLPVVVLGCTPYVIAMVIGSGRLAAFGIVNLLLGAADILLLYVIRGVGGRTLVQDHDSRLGCRVVDAVGMDGRLTPR